MLIYSPRRYGKTSLIKEVLRRAEQKGIFIIYVDLYPALNEEDFIRFFVNAISKEMKGSVENTFQKLKSLFKSFSPRMSIEFGSDGKPNFQVKLEKKDILPALEDVFEGLYKSIKAKKQQAVVVFDEFQQISLFETDQMEKQLRTHIQSHRQISYIFMGSKKHLIFDMFTNPNRPFYKSTKHFPMDKIQTQELAIFIKEKFKYAKKNISNNVIKSILDTTENQPYYTQFLCHILWDITADKNTVSIDDVKLGIETVLEQENAAFSNIWETLTIKQRQVIAALAESSLEDKLFSADFLRIHKIGSVSTMQKALENLVDKDLIDKEQNRYSIIDIFLKFWILRTRNKY